MRDNQGCSCDSDMKAVPVEVALEHALALVPQPHFSESVSLEQATGRVTADAALAPCPLPPFDNAAMDGYGLDPATLSGTGPWQVTVAGSIRAGDMPIQCPPGAALRILTGAPVPAGVTAIVPQEEVQSLDTGIELRRFPRVGAHIRRAGSDLAADETILPAGRMIGPREAAALAASGHATVAVRPRLKVALVSTGSELQEPGAPLAPGQIWDVNRAQLVAALSQPWIRLTQHSTHADQPERLREAVSRAATTADLIVTTGGISVGDADHMPRIVQEAGGEVQVMKLAMKPGKPFAVGRIGSAIWIALPGNPVAAFVSWTVLGAPIARAMVGSDDIMPKTTSARLGAPVAHKPGRCEYRLAVRAAARVGEGLTVVCMTGVGSHRTAQLAAADGLVRIPGETADIPDGTLVDFLPF